MWIIRVASVVAHATVNGVASAGGAEIGFNGEKVV